MPSRSSSQPSRPARLVRCVAVAGLLAASVAVAGCGSASSSAGAAGSATSSADNAQSTARLKLDQCLRQQGVNVPDNPGGGGAGGRAALSESDRQKLQTAIQGPCKQYQSAAFGNVTDAQRQEFRDALVKFAACMRTHGVDVPDPPANGTGGPPAGANRLDQSDPKVKAATTACQDLRPARPGRPGGTGGAAQ